MIKKIDIIEISLGLLFLFAGFSQITVYDLKPSDLVIIFAFFAFLAKGKMKVKPLFLFFLLSFIYAWFLGHLDDVRTMAANSILFSLVFSFIAYFKDQPADKTIKLLKLFVVSMFVSNLLSLLIFIFFPSLRELVIDSSSVGLRFKGLFNQTNAYAFVLILNLPVSLFFLKSRVNIFNILNVLLIALCLLLSQSRAAILSLLIGMALIYGLYLFRIKKLTKIILPFIFIFIIGFVLINILPKFLQSELGINLERLNPTEIKDHNRSLTDISINSLESDRSKLINAGIDTIVNYPFGLGYQPQHTIIGDLTGFYYIPHNYYVSLILTYGIIVGLIWVFIIVFILSKGLKLLYYNAVSPNNLFYYLTLTLVVVGLYYITHSPEWSYLYFLIAIYLAEFERQNLSSKT